MPSLRPPRTLQTATVPATWQLQSITTVTDTPVHLVHVVLGTATDRVAHLADLSNSSLTLPQEGMEARNEAGALLLAYDGATGWDGEAMATRPDALWAGMDARVALQRIEATEGVLLTPTQYSPRFAAIGVCTPATASELTVLAEAFTTRRAVLLVHWTPERTPTALALSGVVDRWLVSSVEGAIRPGELGALREFLLTYGDMDAVVLFVADPSERWAALETAEALSVTSRPARPLECAFPTDTRPEDARSVGVHATVAFTAPPRSA